MHTSATDQAALTSSNIWDMSITKDRFINSGQNYNANLVRKLWGNLRSHNEHTDLSPPPGLIRLLRCLITGLPFFVMRLTLGMCPLIFRGRIRVRFEISCFTVLWVNYDRDILKSTLKMLSLSTVIKRGVGLCVSLNATFSFQWICNIQL